MRVIISSGHGLHVPGARGIIDEVEEARKVTDRLEILLQNKGIEAIAYHENHARNQRENVNSIINFHNNHVRDLDISIHFNSTSSGKIEDRAIGVETLYETNNLQTRVLAEKISEAISTASGLRNRGAIPRSDIGVLSRTTAPAVLIEVCFVVSRTDTALYQRYFDEICYAIAKTIFIHNVEGMKLSQIDLSNQWPISETNIQAMKNFNVTLSPEYWRSSNIKWLDQLLTNATSTGKLDQRIDNGICNIDVAIEILNDAKIMITPEYWRSLISANSPVRYLSQLLINLSNRSRDVLERIIHAEARGEDLEGQIMVGNVIMNRHRSPNFPDGIHNIIFQSGINSQGILVHQFTPVVNGAYASAVPSDRVKMAVDRVLNGEDLSQGALFFIANNSVSGSWHEQALEPLFVHGGHSFFR